jgi:hypothetical protein
MLRALRVAGAGIEKAKVVLDKLERRESETLKPGGCPSLSRSSLML